MDTDPSSNIYSRVAIGFHWLIALAIPATFALGLYMADLPLSPAKLRYYSWHKWIGVTVFCVMLLRLSWRLTHRPPAMSGHMSVWQQSVANWTHRVLYLLLLAIPLSGWLMSSAKGVPTVYFGIWQLPDLVAKDALLGDRLLMLHRALNYSMAALVVLHTAAALKHHLIDRDDVLPRMLPFLRVR
jgi:cytochrome b561